ncbi:MAG: hypothetical protein IKE05_04025, partial [Clostridia bacterium]|nr:hypothetical protein [Clostridia bacterium]
MDSNPNLELLVEKLFDDDEIIDQIMATDDMMELYTLCQKIQGGYTFEEFLEFFESLVCICLDEAKDLKTFIENNEDKVGKLSEKELKDVSGGVSAKHKLTASVLASIMFLTNAGTSHVRGQEPESAGGNVVLHNLKPG